MLQEGLFLLLLQKKRIKKKTILSTTELLERAYQFMVEYYDVRPPNKLITVYLMGEKQRLADVALETHGLEIPPQNYGYSCIADLSILGNSSKTGLGTMLHELFHLIIRTDIGDIPGWLDEGIACLYEESHWDGDILKSNKIVWRTYILRRNNRAKHPLPILRTIIEENWSEFTPNDATSLCELSVNYAMAKHFAMYLEDKELLQTVVSAYKNRKNVFVDTLYSNESTITILETALNKNLNTIQQDFDDWLETEYEINTKRNADVVLSRMEVLYSGLMYVYSNDSIMSEIKQEHDYLYNQLSQIEKDVPIELYDRSMKFISKAEAYLNRSDYY